MGSPPCHGLIPIPQSHPHPMGSSHPTESSPSHEFIPQVHPRPLGPSSSHGFILWVHPMGPSPSHRFIPIPWVHPHPTVASPPPACTSPFPSPPNSPFLPRPLLLWSRQQHSQVSPIPPNPIPPCLVRAAEPGLQCQPLQEHFGHVSRRFTSSPHLGHGAHHPPAAGPLRHQLFHFTQRGAHPQEELGEVLHPNLFR